MGDEDGCHGLIERRTIHVDGGPDRQHEADDASVDMVVLKEALEGDRQSSRAAGGKEKVGSVISCVIAGNVSWVQATDKTNNKSMNKASSSYFSV